MDKKNKIRQFYGTTLKQTNKASSGKPEQIVGLVPCRNNDIPPQFIVRPFIGQFNTNNTEAGSSTAQELLLPATIDSSIQVDWGDGSPLETFTTGQTVIHDYGVGNEGIYTVKVFSGSDWNLSYIGGASLDRLKITNVSRWGNSYKPVGAVPSAFLNAQNLTVTATDTPDTSQLTNLQNWFRGNLALEEVPSINNWDLVLIGNASATFRDSPLFDQELNLTMPNCVSFTQFLRSAVGFNSPITITLGASPAIFNEFLLGAILMNSPVTINGQISNAASMFQGCTDYDQPTTLNIVDGASCQSAFQSNSNLNSLITINGKIGNPQFMFKDCPVFDQDIGALDISLATISNEMFRNCTNFNNGGSGSINNLDTSNLDITILMFFGCTNFNQNVGAWDLSKLENANAMFRLCTNFNNGGSPDIQNWRFVVLEVTTLMLSATAINQNLSNWERVDSTMSTVTTANSMFLASPQFNNGEIGDTGSSPLTWDLSGCLNANQMFSAASAFNQDVSSFAFGLCADFFGMFQNCLVFNNGGSPNINLWNMSSAVTLAKMFNGALVFNQPIGLWDTSNVQDFNFFLNNAMSFNQDISNLSFQSVPSSSPNMANAFANTALDKTNAGKLIEKIATDFGWDGLPSSTAPATTFNVDIGAANVEIQQGSLAEDAYNWLTDPSYGACTIIGFNPTP